MRAFRARADLRDAAWALAFALWCVAWPMGIVLAGGSTPGFFSLRGDDGLREIVQFFVPLSYGAALFAWGVIGFAAMWALLKLRRWLDPDGRALDAIRWALSSRSLNLAAASLLLAVCLLTLTGMFETWRTAIGRISPETMRFLASWWWLILSGAMAVLALPVLTCLLNPETLARDRLERWWRPFWPGITALMVAVACWIVVPLFVQPALDRSTDSMPPLVFLASQCLQYLLGLASKLLALAWWFARGHLSDGMAWAARLFRWRSVRVYLAFDILIMILFLALVIPIVLLSLFVIHIAPQYAYWQEAGIIDMPVAYGLLADWARGMGEGLSMLHDGAVIPDALLVVALGRLLYLSADAGPSASARNIDGAGR